MRRHTAQPSDVGIPPSPAHPEPLIGEDAAATAPPPAPVVILPPGGPAQIVGAAGDADLPLVGPGHLVGAAGDGQGPDREYETPNVVVTDMELPRFDIQLKLPELNLDGF